MYVYEMSAARRRATSVGEIQMSRPQTPQQINNSNMKKTKCRPKMLALISLGAAYTIILHYFMLSKLLGSKSSNYDTYYYSKDTSTTRHHHIRHDHEIDDQLKLSFKCPDQSSDLRDMISETNQVIILMPAKAAGTSLKEFAIKCNPPSYSRLKDNFINFDIEQIVTNSLQMPNVIASHINNDDNLIYMINNIPKSTLLIYIHRDETQRVTSAINEVVTNWCRRGNGHPNILLEPPSKFFYKEDMNKCYVSEEQLINDAIKNKVYEIGIGQSELLSCDTYDAIRMNAPTMAFISYNQVNELQELLADRYCPDLVNEQVVSNVGSNKEYQAYVRGKSSKESSPIPLSKWLQAKQNTLEWSLGLNNDATCTAKTRLMEKKLLDCDSGFLTTVVTDD